MEAYRNKVTHPAEEAGRVFGGGGSGWGEWSHLLPSIFQGKWLQLLPGNSSFIKAFEKVSANSRAGPGLTAGGPSPLLLAGAENWQAADGGLSPRALLQCPQDSSSGRGRPFTGFLLAQAAEESPPTSPQACSLLGGA